MTTSAQTSIQPDHDQDPASARTESPPGRHRGTTISSLRRLYPYARPALPWIAGSAVAAAVATLCGLAFPLVIQQIIDGPITERRPVGALAARRSCCSGWASSRPACSGCGGCCPRARRCGSRRPCGPAIYDHLQRLPVAFHDRWPAGQLMSRAVSDLATIRRFLAFGLVFLVVNLTTFVVGVGILLEPVLAARADHRRAGGAAGGAVLPVRVQVPGAGPALAGPGRRPGHHGRGIGARHPDPQGVRPQRAPRPTLPARGRRPARHRDRQGQGDLEAVGGDRRAARGRLRDHLVARASPRSRTASCPPGTLVAFFGVALGLRWPIDSIGWLLAMSQRRGERVAAVLRGDGRADHRDLAGAPRCRLPPAARPVGFSGVRFRFADAAAGAPDLLRGDRSGYRAAARRSRWSAPPGPARRR